MPTQVEILPFLWFGLQLGFYLGSIVLSRLDIPHLAALSKEEAKETIIDVAEDVVEEEITVRINDLCNHNNIVVDPDFRFDITDFLFDASSDLDDKLFHYYDLIRNGVASETIARVVASLPALEAQANEMVDVVAMALL